MKNAGSRGIAAMVRVASTTSPWRIQHMGMENPIESLAPAEEVKTNSLFSPMRDAQRALMLSSSCLQTEEEPVEAAYSAFWSLSQKRDYVRAFSPHDTGSG
jgi:hypothetical protein